MTLGTTGTLDHLSLGERPQYGMPYPEGIAVVSDQTPDDASGGIHTWTFTADPGFLYRLELFNWTRGEATVRLADMITTHRWATGKHSGGPTGFDLNWILEPAVGTTFGVYVPVLQPGEGNALEVIRRFPMGALLGGLAPGIPVQLLTMTNRVNTTGITNEISIVWTYWRKEALYLPGFLSAFYEAPAVPPLVRQ